MYNIKRFEADPANKVIQQAVNAWQKDPNRTTYKGTHYRARPYIPMEINGKVEMMCPDTGKRIEVPNKIIKYYERRSKRTDD